MTPAWLIPDPDEFDAPCVCDVCGVEVAATITTHRPDLARHPSNGRFTGKVKALLPSERRRNTGRPVVCVPCRLKGWRGRWCECGAVFHKRDYQGGACGKCRAEIYERRRVDAA